MPPILLFCCRRTIDSQVSRCVVRFWHPKQVWRFQFWNCVWDVIVMCARDDFAMCFEINKFTNQNDVRFWFDGKFIEIYTVIITCANLQIVIVSNNFRNLCYQDRHTKRLILNLNTAAKRGWMLCMCVEFIFSLCITNLTNDFARQKNRIIILNYRLNINFHDIKIIITQIILKTS